MNRLNVERVIKSMTTVLGGDTDRISLTIGLSLGLLLPVTPDKELRNYAVQWTRYYAVPIRTFISAFNERHLINTDKVEEIARTVWEYRFQIANFRDLKNPQNVLSKQDPIAELLAGHGLDTPDINKVAAVATTNIPNILLCLNEVLDEKVS